ncbi:hypothetical protein GALMADRAFT_1031465 [Galerina marginata CBS 339.88]|uniref:Secreted protein n=1 Tax=Galerina marginata (strain CBS 339.88) TaxID=685588 RepID=A0A067SD30_GALM3|nr:hypothetical protein GALMADRAFT_1031465 [Galerina marginata CBS 339.88]
MIIIIFFLRYAKHPFSSLLLFSFFSCRAASLNLFIPGANVHWIQVLGPRQNLLFSCPFVVPTQRSTLDARYCAGLYHLSSNSCVIYLARITTPRCLTTPPSSCFLLAPFIFSLHLRPSSFSSASTSPFGCCSLI